MLFEVYYLTDTKHVAKGPTFDTIKQLTEGLKITNEIKEQMIDYFEKKLYAEIIKVCKWAMEVIELQDKRTLQEKDWKFILDKIDR